MNEVRILRSPIVTLRRSVVGRSARQCNCLREAASPPLEVVSNTFNLVFRGMTKICGLARRVQDHVSAANQRQGRTVPPHPDRGLGHRPALQLIAGPQEGLTGLPASLQSPPTPHRHRRLATYHQVDQRPWTAHLGRRGLFRLTAVQSAAAGVGEGP